MNIMQRTLAAGAIAGSLLVGAPAFAHPYAGPANQSTYTQASVNFDRLALELDLTAEQRLQIQPYVASYRQAQVNVSAAERTAMLSVLTAQQLAQLQALGGGPSAWRQLNLTADQVARLQNLHNQYDAQRLANWQTLVNNISPYLTAAQLAELQGLANGGWDRDDDWDDDHVGGGQGPAWSRPVPPGNGNPAWGRPTPPGNGNPAWDRDDDGHDHDHEDDDDDDDRGNGNNKAKGKNKNR